MAKLVFDIKAHMLAKIRAGTDPTDYEDEEEVETVSDGEINDREPSLVGREIVALSDEDMDDNDVRILLYVNHFYVIFLTKRI